MKEGIPPELRLTRESSERSSRKNWVKDYLERKGLLLLSFEGYTIRDKGVSALFERARTDVSPDEWTCAHLLEEIVSEETEPVWHGKLRCQEILEVPFFFVLYSSVIDSVRVLSVRQDGLEDFKTFSSQKDFGAWTMDLRDLTMKSPFQEKGLPKFDQGLRAAGTPWPGNLDSIWFDRTSGDVLALIEFSTTISQKVKNHCHNDWFLPRGTRKGDVNRWLVLDLPRIQLGRPLLVIVWSPNDFDRDIKLKLVDHIVYPWDKDRRKLGLVYKAKEVLGKEELIDRMREFVSL